MGPLNAILRISAVAAALAVVCPAVTLRQMSVDEMTAQSTAIVYAKVVDSYGAQHGSMIFTHYRIQVLQALKSGPAVIREIMVPGGTAGGLRQNFAGVPGLDAGKCYLMFLWAGSVGVPQLTGLTQGLFDVAPDASGNLVGSRPMSPEQMLDGTGRAVQDRPVRIAFQDVAQRVTDSLRAVNSPKTKALR